MTEHAIETGKLWWIAYDQLQAEDWKAKLLNKGAVSVELRPQAGKESVDVIITLPLNTANDVVGFEIWSDEWVNTNDPLLLAVL